MYDKGWRANGQYNDMNRLIWEHVGVSGFNPVTMPLGMMASTQLGLDKLLQNIGVSGRLASWITGSSLITRLFGGKKPQMRGGGVEGDLSLEGFTGQQFQDIEQSGGLMRGNRHWTEWQDIDPELQKMIDQTIGKVPGQIKKLLGEFQINFNDVFGEDWAQKFHIVLTTDGKWENLAEMFDKETTRVYRELATTAVEAIREGWGQYVDDLKDLSPDDFRAAFSQILESLSVFDNIKGYSEKVFGVAGLIEDNFEALGWANEKIYETISRLANTYTLTNKIGKYTGISFAGTGLESAKDRQALVDDAGGMDALSEIFNTYFATFATQSEQLAEAFAPVQGIFEQLGIDTIPRSTQAFKDLIAAQDMSTDEGRQAALNLMGAADLWKQSAGAFEEMKNNLSASIADMRRSFELDGLSNDEKYNKLKAEADAAWVQLQSASDPYEIQKLLDTIRTDMTSTWSLLTDEQKNAMRDQYLAKLDELESMGLSRIDAAADDYLGAQTAADAIADAGDTLAAAISSVADNILNTKPQEMPTIDRLPMIQELPEITRYPQIDDVLQTTDATVKQIIDDLMVSTQPLLDSAMAITKPLIESLNVLLTKPDGGGLKPDVAENADADFIAALKLLDEMMTAQRTGGSEIAGGAEKATDVLTKGADKAGDAIAGGGNTLLAAVNRAALRWEDATASPVRVEIVQTAPEPARASQLS
jgi:hypothetical protein